MVKQIKVDLSTAWDTKGVFAAAIKTARKSGVKDKKLGDFSDDKLVSKAEKLLDK